MKSDQQPMRSVWESLLWKEWHEHKWKLAALTAVSLVGLFFLLFVAGPTWFLMDVMFAMFACYVVPASVFLGMSTAGRESGQRTLPFLQSLPSPMWQPGIAKLGAAIFTVFFPVLLLVLVSLFFQQWTGNVLFSRHSANQPEWLTAQIVVGVLGVVSLLLWMATAGYNRSDEIRAGAIGFLVISSVWMAFGCVGYFADRWQLYFVEEALDILAAALPGGVITTWQPQLMGDGARFSLCILVYVIGHGCVLFWYLRRFGRGLARPRRTEESGAAVAFDDCQVLAPPMRSQLTAIAWKQLREIGPIALLAAVGMVVLTVMLVWANEEKTWTANTFGHALAAVTLSVALLVTLVTGIGTFFEDLKPGVEDFWRSRPFSFSLWFGMKFMTGLLVLGITFGTFWLFAFWLTDARLLLTDPRLEITVFFKGMLLLIIYTLSLATYCVLRQPVYAVFTTIGLIFAGAFVMDWGSDKLLGSFERHWSVFFMLLTMFFFQIAAIVIAWLAVRSK